ncbi:unnamed protein product [Acanthosepion pharaonis]|uniref:MRN complex-interacting protein N-terminal domain-containing protein n=1 Tax=Acanthosepion pharaonis TaxID=158019 RepID=A0A812BAS1_ACAPH|nr:unnamed protein product [Sepia pharaonis]
MKKSKKWACKVCGEKQSLIKIYGQGTGAECRQHVQKLNLLQQDMDEKDYQMIINQDFLDISEETDCPNFTSEANRDMKWPQHSESSSSSKWSKFLPCEVDTETNELQMEEVDYIKENNKEKKAGLEEFNKFPCQEKRKNPFSEICFRDSFTNSGYLMKKPRTAPKCDFQLGARCLFNEEAIRIGLHVNNTKLMHVGDGPDLPTIVIGNDSVEFAMYFVYLYSKFSNTSRRSTEDLGRLQASWETSGDHYDGIPTTPNTSSYEFTAPLSSLCYYTIPRCDLSARPSPHDSMASCAVPPVRYCVQ